MWIEIINGPNLARIGQREPSIYGTMSMDTCLEQLHQRYDHQLRLTYFQSNHEGALLDRLYELHDAGADAIILNAGAYTHTSLALADALRAITPPTIEVHISNIYKREPIPHRRGLPRDDLGLRSRWIPLSHRSRVWGLTSTDPRINYPN